ncbi:MAG: DUF695 domain-containing protein [Bacteroidetes bacterium]|nr:MAG: DUF695 domain-containing protein [Bacteroidota bacterium]
MKTITFLLTLILILNLNAQNHKQEWNFYFCQVDGKEASIYLDLGLINVAPVPEMDHLFWVSIKMNNPRTDGMSSREESSKLWEIEDFIVEQLVSNHQVIYVGRLTSNNCRDLFFYLGKDKLVEKTLSTSFLKFPEYKFDHGINENDNWDLYLDFLFPDPETYQSIMNRRVLDYMEEQGDQLTQERQVDHWIYFKTESGRDEFEKEVVKRNFKITSRSFVEDTQDLKYQLVISRIDKISLNEIDAYTIELWKLAIKYNGDYDGWEAPLIVDK